ncbi:hypothetical protein RCL1_001046 [Eukaryota sp. TZLM3-RCL]
MNFKAQLVILVNVFILSLLRLTRIRSVESKLPVQIAKEIRRKTYHIAGIVYPSLIYLAQKHLYWNRQRLTLLFAIFLICFDVFEASRLLSPSFNRTFFSLFSRTRRSYERHTAVGTFVYTLSSLICVFFFPPLCAAAGMFVYLVGDLAAAIVGKASKHKTQLNGSKTLQGSIGGFLVSFTLLSLVLRGLYISSTRDCMILSLFSSLFGIISEIAAGYAVVNDNLVMPIMSAFGCSLAGYFFRIREAWIHLI